MRRRVGPGALILALALVLYLLHSRFYYVGQFNDDACYVLGAQSLLHGRYVDLADPYRRALTVFPPGFPLFLAPFVLVLAPHWGALKLVAIGVSLASGLAAARLFGRWLSPAGSLTLLALYAFNAAVATAASWVMSDIFFTLLALIVFSLLRRVLERDTMGRFWLLGAALGWALIVRPPGVILAASVAAGLSFARRWRAAAVSSGFALAVWAGVILRNLAVGRSPSGYWPRWQESVSSLGHPLALCDNVQRVVNLFFVSVPFGLRLPYSPFGFVASAAIVLACCLVAARGACAVAARGPQDKSLAGALILYCLGLFAVNSSWAAIDVRYAFPVLPVLLALLVAGVPRLGLGHLGGRGLAALAAASLLWSNAAALRRGVGNAAPPSLRFPGRTVAWLRRETPADAVLLSSRAAMLHLYARRLAVTDPGRPANDKEEFRYALLCERISYLVDPPLRALYRPRPSVQPGDLIRQRGDWAAAWPEAFRPVFRDSSEATTVYEVVADASFLRAYGLYLAARRDLESSRLQEGLRGLRAALAIRPDFVKALNAYGAACLLSGTRLGVGEAMLKRALESDPHYFWAWLNLSRLYRRTGRIALAQDALDHAAADLARFPSLVEMGPVLGRERAELEACARYSSGARSCVHARPPRPAAGPG